MTCKFHRGIVLYIEGTTNEWMVDWFFTVMCVYVYAFVCVGGRGGERRGDGRMQMWMESQVTYCIGALVHFICTLRFGRCISSQSVILANKNKIRGGS